MNRKRTVLVCDDDPVMRSVLSEMLVQHGYKVQTAACGEEAVSIAMHQQTDLILLDLLLPHMGGWEVVAALRSQDGTSGIPIVVVSIFSPGESEVASRTVQGWVEKPIIEANLIAAIEKALRMRAIEVPRVLVVEDDDATASMLRALLERHGMSFHRAISGVEAIHIASWLRPDLLVLDVLLPELDGYSVIKWLRKHEQLRSTPVIVYSGAKITEADRSRLELGPTEFVGKGLLPIGAVEQKALQILAASVR